MEKDFFDFFSISFDPLKSMNNPDLEPPICDRKNQQNEEEQ